MRLLRAAALGAFSLAIASANDVVFLNGMVTLPDHSAPGKSVEIKLNCPGSDPVRRTTTNKKGKYFLKVERDEFNHVARALPSTSMDLGSGGLSGDCRLVGVLAGYQSSEIKLSAFTIGKDLKLPELVLTPAAK